MGTANKLDSGFEKQTRQSSQGKVAINLKWHFLTKKKSIVQICFVNYSNLKEFYHDQNFFKGKKIDVILRSYPSLLIMCKQHAIIYNPWYGI